MVKAPSSKTVKSTKTVWIRRIGLLGVVALLYIYVPKVDWKGVKEAILRAHMAPILLSLMGLYLFWFVRGTVLWMILRLKEPVQWGFVMSVNFIGAMTDQLIPARAGYVVRWLMLSRRMRTAKSFIFSALIAVFMMEAVVLVVLFFSFFIMQNEAQTFSSPKIIIALLSGVGLIVLCVIFSKQLENLIKKTKLKKITPLMALFEIAHDAKRPERLIGWGFLILMAWVGQVFVLYCAGQAFDINLTVTQMIILLMSVNLAIIIPVVPGNLGTIQLVLTWVLVKMGFEQNAAIATSLVYHAIVVLPIIATGAALTFITQIKPPIVHTKSNVEAGS